MDKDRVESQLKQKEGEARESGGELKDKLREAAEELKEKGSDAADRIEDEFERDDESAGRRSA